MCVRRLVVFTQVVAQAHDGERLLISDMAERGAHQGIGELTLPHFKVFQGHATAGNRKEVEVSPFGILKKVFCLHAGIESVHKPLRRDREFTGDLGRFDCIWRQPGRVVCTGTRKQQNGSDASQ